MSSAPLRDAAREFFRRGIKEGVSRFLLDARRMSTSTGAFGLAAHNRKKSSRKVLPQHFLVGEAVAAVVLGCAWTVYTNVLGASIYPSVNSAAFDAPVVKQSSVVVARPARPTFNEVFASLPAPAPKISAPETAPSSIMFNERFAASAPQGEPSRAVEATQVAEAARVEAPKKAETPRLAEAPKPKEAAPQPAPAQVALNVPPPAPAPVSKQAEAKPPAKGPGASVRDMAQRAKTAVYDIAAKMVYLPDGTRLEAHSGLGSKLDDARYSHVRMQGVTPPHIYELTPREALFHGVPALRLSPIGGEEKIFGRSGLLAHTYMLGPNGDSNGCVSFKDYYAFLNAYRNQGIRRLAVLARVE